MLLRDALIQNSQNNEYKQGSFETETKLKFMVRTSVPLQKLVSKHLCRKTYLQDLRASVSRETR